MQTEAAHGEGPDSPQAEPFLVLESQNVLSSGQGLQKLFVGTFTVDRFCLLGRWKEMQELGGTLSSGCRILSENRQM